MRIWCAVAVLFIMTTPARTASVAAGVGVRSCAQFAKDFQNNPANAETVYNNWALGFLTGLNAGALAADNPKRDLEAISFEDKKQFMRDYCDMHPLNLYLRGVLELFGSLPFMPGDRPK